MTDRNATDVIDVNELIARYDLDHHRASADRYFQPVRVTDGVMRKPFANPLECVHLLPGIAAVINGLDLFSGARVLDFGCGGGWLARIFAHLDCEAYGVDLAPSAVAVANELAARDPFAEQLALDFKLYDGKQLPFADEFFDGAAVFDAFHHLHDQERILKEFYRTLKPGTSVVFHEPGPNHSGLPQSQTEMRNFGVIERDTDMRSIEMMAGNAGFEPPIMATYFTPPLWTTNEFFELMLKPEGVSADVGDTVRGHLRLSFENLRVFKLKKPGTIRYDSRSPARLHGTLSCHDVSWTKDAVKGKIVAQNTGTSWWLPSSGGKGSVNIGLQLCHPDGRVERDFARLPFLTEQLGPGGSIETEFHLTLPEQSYLRVDLVAEGVAWFENVTGNALVIPRR